MRLSFYKNILPDSNSQTTLEVRHFLECGATLFDADDKYPIWDEKHRPELEKKITEHYYNRQIGFETFGRFKFELNKKMREIMPYYVEIWKTTQYEYNPIENYSMTEEFKDKTDNTASSEVNTFDRMHDTPQTKVSEFNDDFLTTVNKGDNKGQSKSNTAVEHTAWRKGNIGVTTTQQMIEQERKVTINLDMMIIEELQPLFLGVY